MLIKSNNNSLLQVARHVSIQLLDMVSVLEADIYPRPLEVLSHASIGQHVRHILEFFQCLVACTGDNHLNYDKRSRNLLIEQQRESSLALMQDLIAAMDQLDLDRRLMLEADYGSSKETYVLVETTVGRELSYNIEHAIHHMALIKIGLIQSGSSYIIPADFGVASSTLQYRQEIQCAQ